MSVIRGMAFTPNRYDSHTLLSIHCAVVVHFYSGWPTRLFPARLFSSSDPLSPETILGKIDSRKKVGNVSVAHSIVVMPGLHQCRQSMPFRRFTKGAAPSTSDGVM